MAVEAPWYQELRERYRPDRVHLLLIGESAPTDHGGSKTRNFFYADHLGPDNLYRGVTAAMYGVTRIKAGSHDKTRWLRRLQADGVYLIDLAPYPVNAIKPEATRRAILREHSDGCVREAVRLRPEGIVLVGGVRVHDVLAGPLLQAGLPVLHDRPISFPLGNVRQQFVESFREAIAPLGIMDLSDGVDGTPH